MTERNVEQTTDPKQPAPPSVREVLRMAVEWLTMPISDFIKKHPGVDLAFWKGWLPLAEQAMAEPEPECKSCKFLSQWLDNERGTLERERRVARDLVNSLMAETTQLKAAACPGLHLTDDGDVREVRKRLPVAYTTQQLLETARTIAQERGPKCHSCGSPATCFGAYEGHGPTYSCSECCGHGNEDGHCDPIAQERGQPQGQRGKPVEVQLPKEWFEKNIPADNPEVGAGLPALPQGQSEPAKLKCDQCGGVFESATQPVCCPTCQDYNDMQDEERFQEDKRVSLEKWSQSGPCEPVKGKSQRVWPTDEEALRLCLAKHFGPGSHLGADFQATLARGIAAAARELQAEESAQNKPPCSSVAERQPDNLEAGKQQPTAPNAAGFDSTQGEQIKALKELVIHCWVHSGYQNCGYSQMDSNMRKVYDIVLEENRKEMEDEEAELVAKYPDATKKVQEGEQGRRPTSSARGASRETPPNLEVDAAIATSSCQSAQKKQDVKPVGPEPALTLPDGRPVYPFRLEGAMRGEEVVTAKGSPLEVISCEDGLHVFVRVNDCFGAGVVSVSPADLFMLHPPQEK